MMGMPFLNDGFHGFYGLYGIHGFYGIHWFHGIQRHRNRPCGWKHTKKPEKIVFSFK